MGIIYILTPIAISNYELPRYYGTEAKDRNGPVGFSELKDLFAEGNITAKTKVWAQGMEGWRLLHQVMTPIITVIINDHDHITIIARCLSSSGRWSPGEQP